jgi:RND family efflux transporter MFP subunit
MKTIRFFSIVLILAIIGCGEKTEPTKKEDEDKVKKNFPVEFIEVGPGEIRRALQSQARLESKRMALISPQVSGRIESELMEEGMTVQEGDLLIQLSTPPGVHFEMERLALRIEQSELKLQRQKNLKKKAPAAISDATIEQTELELKGLILDLSKEKEEAEYRSIKAPFAGALDSVKGDIGQQVGPSTVLAKLHDLSELRISVDTTEARLQELRLGQKVLITLLSDQSQAEGQVAHLPSAINESSGSGKVIVKLKEHPKHWLAGAFVIVEFQMDLIKANLVIPKKYISYKQNRPYVWIATQKDDNSVAKQVFIEIGDKDENLAVITSGLKTNDKLIVEGLKGMREGMRLELRAHEEEGSSAP